MFRVPSGLDYEGKMRHHMAHVVSLLGPPPVDFLKRSETEEPWKYFDAQGERALLCYTTYMLIGQTRCFRQLDWNG